MFSTTKCAVRGESHARAPSVRGLLTGLIFVAAFILPSCGPVNDIFSLSPPSNRILFIGNSFTDFNGGMDQALKGLDPSIAAGRIAPGGYTLENHWNGGEALNAIHSRKWNYVVLQDQSQAPVTNPAEFLAYAGKFGNEIKAAGAVPILFMTWQRPDSIQYGVTTQNLANAYYSAGNRYGIKVAPVGLAFAQALWERPALQLYVEDGHPTIEGTYLASCVFYATLFAKTPVGLSYAPSGLSSDERDFLQKVAAETTGY
jgi:hypothetical protein